jgi:predicted metal-dependent hydrolase
LARSLIIAPAEVLRYVAVHELCHLVEPSHSKRSWATLSSAAPDWRDADGWLSQHGAELRSYSYRSAV